jgi:hypothetical protein
MSSHRQLRSRPLGAPVPTVISMDGLRHWIAFGVFAIPVAIALAARLG